MAPKVQVNQLKYKRKSGFADTQGQDFEVNLATLLFLRGINSGKSFLLGTNMEGAEKFDDIIFKPEIGNSCETYFIQQKHKNRGSVPIECLKNLQGDLSLFTYYKSFVQIKENYQNSLVLQDLGDFDSFKFTIYIDAGISNTDKYIKNANANLNSGNKGNCISFSPGDEIYTTFENWKYVKSFLENNHESAIKENLNDLKEVVKNDAIIKEVEKNGKELEKIIGDLSLYKEFLSQIEIYSSQKNENLEKNIRKEIEIAFETSGDLTEKVFYKLRNSIKKYGELKGNQPFLNKSEEFWEKISSNMIAEVQSLSQKKVSEFTAMNINFEQSHLTSLVENLRNTQVLHILLPETMNMLSSLKTYQTVKCEHFIFTDFNSLTDQETTFLEFWKTVWCKYLIIEDIESPKDISRLIGDVSNILNKYKEKKLLLIGPKNGTLVSHLRSESTIFHDKYNLTNLNSNSQNVILNKSVIFQGHGIPLHSIINTEESSMSLISNDCLCQLVCSKDIKIGSELKKGLDSYIHRILTRNIFVKDVKNFPKHDFKITVTATNIDVQDLIEGGTDNVSTGSENTHWFHHESDGKVVWKQTKGDIESVHQFLDEENWRNFEPETLTDIEDKIVLIVGKPGMGKTTLMNQLAIQTKQRVLKDPSSKSVWIVQVNLVEHTSFLQKMKENTENLNINTILEFLQGNVLRLDLEIEKQMFLHSMKKQGNVVIIFDAYDEISSTYGEQVIKILNELQKINKGRMYVTSRCKDRKKLEQELSTLAFTLQPFQKGEQQSYLESMWKLKYPNIDQIVLKNFVDRLLSLASICDKKKNFMSVPLQVMMLAEVYEDYIEKETDLPPAIDLLQLYEQFVEKRLHILSTEKNKCDLSNPRMQRMWEREKQEFMKNHKLSAMVSLFPEENLKTLKNFRKPTEFLSDVARGIETSEVIEDVIEGKPHFTHQAFAEYFAAVWFSENFELNTTFYIDHFLRSNYDVLKNMLDRVLVKGKDLHKAVLNNDKESIKCLLEEKCDANDFDKGHRTALHLAVCLGNYSHNVADDDYDDYSLKFSEFLYGHRPTENAADADHIVEILLKSKADVSIRDGILQWTPLKYADMYGSSFRTLGLLLEYNANPNELTETKKLFQVKKTDIEKHLQMATQQGYTKLIEFMIDNGVDLKLPQEIVRVKKEYTTVVHESILCNKYDVIDMLVYKKPDIINIRDSNQNTALHLVSQSEEGDIKSVEFLIDRNCDINPKNADGNTPLHLAARIGHLHIIQYLVEHGASVKALNNENYAAIHLAAHQGKLEVLRYLFDIQGKQFCVKDDGPSTTPLHLAVRKGHKDIVKYLLEQDIDIDICDKYGNSALHMTNLHNDIDMIKCLIDRGADVNKKNEKGETVIFWAYENGGIEILKYLNEKKADFNVKWNDDDTLLIHAGRNGKFEILEYLSKLKSVDVSVCNKNGNNVLHNAAQHGHVKIVSYLFNNFRRTLNNANKNYETPLLVAALYYKWDVVRLLEKDGANLHVKNADGTTVLHIASEQGILSVVKWLLQKNVKMTIKTKKGDSILHFAAKAGAQNILQYFSEEQQVDFEIVNNSGDTLLHSAVQGNHIETVKYLLDLNIDVNRKNKYGKTPLHEAVTKSFVLIQILLMAGANADVKDKKGNTALHLAASNEELKKTKLCGATAHEGLINAVKFLINSGANLNIQNALRKTPFLLAIENKNSDFVKITLDTYDLDSALFIVSLMGLWTMLPDLLEKGANLNTNAFCGITPLHVAAFANELDVVKYLLNKKAFINQESNKRITPLHFAAFKGHKDIVKLLLYKGSVINKKDFLGNTALHCAVRSGSISVVKLLVMKGASITIKNKSKKSPLDLAKSMKLREVEHLLHVLLKEAVDNFVDPSRTTYEVAG